jgi:NTE family protein
MTDGESTKVAIACQGGGSHTAFTAGVLKGLLREWDEGYELVGISGTSGGAFNALAAWYGLVTADEEAAAFYDRSR